MPRDTKISACSTRRHCSALLWPRFLAKGRKQLIFIALAKGILELTVPGGDMQGQHMTSHPGLVQFRKETTGSHSPAELTVHTAEHLEEAGPRRVIWPGGLLLPGSGAKQAGSQQHSTQQLHPALQRPRDREGQSHGQSCDPAPLPQHLRAPTASPPPCSSSVPPSQKPAPGKAHPALHVIFFPLPPVPHH